jgi:hypothetical protein
MLQTKTSREKWTVRAALIAVGISALSALFTGWQAYEAHQAANREESPMVRASLTQEVREGIRPNTDRHGKLSIEVTNLGHRTMQLKNITLSAWKRVWIVLAPDKKEAHGVTGHRANVFPPNRVGLHEVPNIRT